MSILCRLGLHKWLVAYSDPPRVVEKCGRAGCRAARSTTYDMAYGHTYWVPGDFWSQRKQEIAEDDAVLVERLAALAHEQWSGWVEWMFEKWDETHASGETYQARWRRQMSTSYAELSEAEKENDRIEARKVLAVLQASDGGTQS